MNVILCGYNWVGCKALEILKTMGHNVFVFTHETPYYVPSLVSYCKKIMIPYSLENISKTNLPFKPDIIISLHYRYVIKKHIIDLCEGKIFNLHSSLLPNYRGCSGVTWAMINGENEVGYTYHYIDEGIDTGNILFQKSIPVEEFDTQQTLYMRVMFESMKEFEKVFNKVSEGVPGTKQPEGGSYYHRGCPLDGQIDPNWDFESKERFIRAMIFPPLPVAKLGEKNIYSIDDLIDK